MRSYDPIFIEAFTAWPLAHVGCSVGFSALMRALEVWVWCADRDTNTRPLAHAGCSAGFSVLVCTLELWAWHADTEAVAWQLG